MLALCTLPDGRLLSGAGDGTVGVWRRPVSSAVSSAGFAKESECRVQTVVRGLAPYSGGFAQVGNDGVLRLWALDTALVAGAPRLVCRCADDL